MLMRICEVFVRLYRSNEYHINMRKAQTDDSKEATLDLHLRSLMILLLGVYLLWINTNISPVDSCNMIRKKYIQESVIRGCKVSTTEDVIPKGNVRDKNCILYVSLKL